MRDIVADVNKEFQGNETTTESANVNVDISGQIDGINSKDLEQALKDVVVSVTKELQSSTTPISVEEPVTEAALTTTTPATTTTTTTTTTTENNDLVFENTPIATEIEEDGERESQARPRKLSDTVEFGVNGTDLVESSGNKTSCDADQFKCGDDSCIDKYLRCDKIFDCLDASDESGCGKSIVDNIHQCFVCVAKFWFENMMI